jgi:hypothetical protein
MPFADILTKIPDEAERTQLAALSEKYPEVKRYVELGQVAAPITEKLTAMNAKAEDELKYLPEWVEYRQKQFDPERQMYKREIAAMDRATALETELNELRARGAEEMTPEQIGAYLATNGVALQKDLEALKANVITPDKLNSARLLDAKQWERVAVTLIPKVVSHRERFKEDIPMDKVFEYMDTSGEKDPAKAYDIVMGPKVRELEKAETAAAIEAARQEGIDKGRQEAIMSRNGSGMPVSSGGGSRGTASFMANVYAKREAAKAKGTSGGRLGDGTATRDGFSEWNKKAAGSVGTV